MCPPDPTPDPKPPAPAIRQAVTVRPTEVLDPYPERVIRHGGVRQHTALTATRTRKSTTRFFRRGRRRPFGASVLITIAAQGALAATIATRTVPPTMGALAAIGLMLCGLGLIVAELIQVGSR